MTRFIFSSMAAILVVAWSATAQAQTSSPSLGDYARSVRQSKPQEAKAPAKVYDNDNLPSGTAISVVGSAPQTGEDTAKGDKNNDQSDSKSPDVKTYDKAKGSDSKAGEKTAEKKPSAEVKPGQSLEEREKVYEAWKKRIDDQKKKVDQLARDLDDYQHNSALAQVSLWPDTQRYGQGLIDKQKALDQAKAELSDLQEQARKAGVPASLIG